MRIIDYDQLDQWSPWFGDIMSSIAPKDMLAKLRQARPQYMEDARNYILGRIDRTKLVDHLNSRLVGYEVRVYHGTRVTANEASDIRAAGLRPLRLIDRGDALATVFSEHPDWPTKKGLLGEQLQRFGARWQTAGAGRREDGCVHVCLSRAGILYGCNHYLTHGAEVDQHIANAIFPDGSGLTLLQRSRSAKLVSFTAPFPEAAVAANPYGFPANEMPGLLGKLVTAWAYRIAKPDFSLANEEDGAALRFEGPIPPQRLERIEDIEDAALIRPKA